MVIPFIVVVVIGYVLGALPFGYLVARRHGINIFEHGSKNPGATNVKRVLGEKFGAKGKRAGDLVFALDALKGAASASWALLKFTPVTLNFAFDEWGLSLQAHIAGETWVQLGLAGLIGALIGHSFSCFTGFRGGKGVATTSGGFLVLAPLAILCALVVWLATFFTSRYVSLASILAAVALPVASFALGQPLFISVISSVIGAIVIIRHRTNIKRLLAGTENKFVKKPAGPSA